MPIISLHYHELVEQEEGHMNTKCSVCSGDITEPSFYMCKLCNYCVHTECHQINHPFHHSHPLLLRTDKSFICNSCYRIRCEKPCFGCDECKLYMDVECARLSPLTSDDFDHPNQEHIQHFTHPHLMLLIPITDGENQIKCSACRLPCSTEAFGCRNCEYFLHKSCAQLPQEIQPSSFHKDHPLSLRMANQLFFDCMLCCKSDLIYAYECGPCGFHFCVTCVTTLTQPVKYDYHEHPLYYFERIYTNISECDGYESYCKNHILSSTEELKYYNSSIFGCAQCNFKVHLLCGMLPGTIKYEYHIHPLVLVDSVIENHYGEYCCDICEKKRDPRLRAYFCEDCQYAAHVHCLASEIKNVLKGDMKDVKLKTVGNDLWNFPEEVHDIIRVEETEQSKPFTLRDLTSKLTDEDELRNHFYWDEEKTEVSRETTELEPEDKKIDEILQFSGFTETEFITFIFREFENNFDSGKKLKIKSSDLALKIVNFEDYFMPLNLVLVFKTLLHKYGDIGGYDNYSKEFKSMCYFFLCKAMKEMHSTLVLDITKDLLQHWFYYIYFVDRWSTFEVDFLWESLGQITREFFYLQLSQILEVDIPTIMDKRMEKLLKKMAYIKEKKEEYEKFCKSTSKKEFVKEGLNKVMKLKWKTAGQVGKLYLR